MIYASINSRGIITSISKRPFIVEGQETIKLNKKYNIKLIGKKLPKEKIEGLKVALICNWEDKCGISTYTKFLVNSLTPKVKEIKIFAEDNGTKFEDRRAIACWQRGKSMEHAINLVLKWEPDIVLIQHEFGIFPKATYFLQMLQLLDGVPCVTTLHSVYEHLDKAVCTSSIKNIIVHSKEGKKVLELLGNKNNITVVPHGCLPISENEELWNCFQTPYVIFQFGFGFFYKGVEVALDAIHHLKTTDPKFKNIFYCYLCSESDHCGNIHQNYYQHLQDKIEKLGLRDNVVILRGFYSDQELDYFLRTVKIAIFPYVTDLNNVVYGASGAIRIAMKNNLPVIASQSHLFDDLEGVVPRPKGHLALAHEIDKIFSDEKYKIQIMQQSAEFLKQNSWESVADKYLEVFDGLVFGQVNVKKQTWWRKLLRFLSLGFLN
jgi:glycosyltransferase involved in cell wall biosynthesis